MKHYRLVVEGQETNWYPLDAVGKRLVAMATARLVELARPFAIEYAIL